MLAALASQLSFADYPKPDTTKAAVIDNLCVLGARDDIATPEYLFDTIVTNWMYDATGTNRNYWFFILSTMLGACVCHPDGCPPKRYSFTCP